MSVAALVHTTVQATTIPALITPIAGFMIHYKRAAPDRCSFTHAMVRAVEFRGSIIDEMGMNHYRNLKVPGIWENR